MRRRVLEPLGIPADDLGYGIPDLDRHAQGYLEKYSMLNLVKRLVIDRSLIGGYEGSWLRIEPHVVNGAAFGGLVGNCRGFGRFLRDALLEEPVLPVRAKLFEQQRTRAGTLIPMTLGWHVGQLGSAKHYFKEGGGCGFHCMMRIYPEAGVATVAMVNATQFHVRECLDQVDRQWM
jgi:CubicO group peptidase (beta-lactamase class C family)